MGEFRGEFRGEFQGIIPVENSMGKFWVRIPGENSGRRILGTDFGDNFWGKFRDTSGDNHGDNSGEIFRDSRGQFWGQSQGHFLETFSGLLNLVGNFWDNYADNFMDNYFQCSNLKLHI